MTIANPAVIARVSDKSMLVLLLLVAFGTPLAFSVAAIVTAQPLYLLLVVAELAALAYIWSRMLPGVTHTVSLGADQVLTFEAGVGRRVSFPVRDVVSVSAATEVQRVPLRRGNTRRGLSFLLRTTAGDEMRVQIALQAPDQSAILRFTNAIKAAHPEVQIVGL